MNNYLYEYKKDGIFMWNIIKKMLIGKQEIKIIRYKIFKVFLIWDK